MHRTGFRPICALARLLTQQKYFRRAGKVVFASWAQVGLATAFDQTLLASDRFFAGGGNSVRGYAQDVISPSDFLGTIVGGNALIVLNQEVRFPMFKYVRGVGFIDAGRAFETVGQMSLKDLAVGLASGSASTRPSCCCASTWASRSTTRTVRENPGGSSRSDRCSRRFPVCV